MNPKTIYTIRTKQDFDYLIEKLPGFVNIGFTSSDLLKKGFVYAVRTDRSGVYDGYATLEYYISSTTYKDHTIIETSTLSQEFTNKEILNNILEG